jgi:hypothetical protein
MCPVGGSLGWRDPTYLASKPGEVRALRFIAMLLSVADAYHSQVVNAAMLALAITWNIGLGAGIRRRGRFPQWTVVADVAIVCLLLVVGTIGVGTGRRA